MGFRERFSLSATADEERNQYDRDRQPDQKGREAVANLGGALHGFCQHVDLP